MTPRGQKRVLLGLNILLGVAIAGSIGFAFRPRKNLQTPVDASPKSPSSAATKPAKPEAMAQYAALCQKDLRRPLYDPVIQPTAPPAPPKLSVTLTGTVVDPDSAYGIFRNSAGDERLVSVGQTIEGAEVISIQADGAKVKYYGQIIDLKAQKKGGP